MTRLYLIRHGETAWNKERKIQGSTDIPLSAKGKRQAKLAADRLAGAPLAAVYSSDLSRALSTARAVRRRHRGVPLKVETVLRERNWGAVEGMRWDEIQAKRPGDIKAILSGDPAFRPKGGESKLDVLKRCVEFLDLLPERHPGASVAAVTHGGFCSTLLKHVLGVDHSRRPPFFMENCAISVLEWHSDGSWFVRTLNDMAHLEAMAKNTKPYG